MGFPVLEGTRNERAEAATMDNGWNASAAAWIATMGERGDWGREFVLDPAIETLLGGRTFQAALDVGCGEGRFARQLKKGGRAVRVVGIDPTRPLLARARQRDPDGEYLEARAEAMPFEAARFDLVVSYLTLIDIPDFRAALKEMARVLRPGGCLLIANINAFISAGVAQGWVSDTEGNRLHYPVDRYLEEFAEWTAWNGIRIVNWHRPLSAYLSELLAAGLTLRHFSEPRPQPTSDNPDRASRYCRAPWFLLMEWQKPG